MIRCIFLLLVCSVYCTAQIDFIEHLPDTVFVESSKDVAEGKSFCEGKGKSCIVVSRGCREQAFPIDENVGSEESENKLLSRVYGPVPLQDSSKVYGQWASTCKSDESSRRTTSLLYGILVGGFSTALGVGLFSIDYEHAGTKVVGRTFGGLFLATGIIYLAVNLVMIPVFLFKEPDKRIQKYEERKKAWKLRVVPSVNIQELGGGLFMLLGF